MEYLVCARNYIILYFLTIFIVKFSILEDECAIKDM